jgi:hypothetical protein
LSFNALKDLESDLPHRIERVKESIDAVNEIVEANSEATRGTQIAQSSTSTDIKDSLTRLDKRTFEVQNFKFYQPTKLRQDFRHN